MTDIHSVQHVMVKRSVESNVRNNEEARKYFWNAVSVCVSGDRYDQLMKIKERFDQWSPAQLLEEIIYEGLSVLYGLAKYDEAGGQ